MIFFNTCCPSQKPSTLPASERFGRPLPCQAVEKLAVLDAALSVEASKMQEGTDGTRRSSGSPEPRHRASPSLSSPDP